MNLIIKNILLLKKYFITQKIIDTFNLLKAKNSRALQKIFFK